MASSDARLVSLGVVRDDMPQDIAYHSSRTAVAPAATNSGTFCRMRRSRSATSQGPRTGYPDIDMHTVLAGLALGVISEQSDIFCEVHRATLTNQEPNQLQIPANVST
jgi:hypothetical protein